MDESLQILKKVYERVLKLWLNQVGVCTIIFSSDLLVGSLPLDLSWSWNWRTKSLINKRNKIKTALNTHILNENPNWVKANNPTTSLYTYKKNWVMELKTYFTTSTNARVLVMNLSSWESISCWPSSWWGLCYAPLLVASNIDWLYIVVRRSILGYKSSHLLAK